MRNNEIASVAEPVVGGRASIPIKDGDIVLALDPALDPSGPPDSLQEVQV